MRTYYRHTSRELKYQNFNLFLVNTLISPFLGKLALLSMLPAFFNNCAQAIDEQTATKAEWGLQITSADCPDEIHTLDLFVFRDAPLQRLDCYQRFDIMEDWKGTVISGSGERIMTALANFPMKREDWFSLNSRSYLKNLTVNLEDETREHPFMAGEISVNAENSRFQKTKELPLHPYTGEIRLQSICCDFKGKAYEGEKLCEAKIYLTNINAECGILEDEGTPPRRIINAGRLIEEDMEKFAQPDLIMQEIAEEVGARTLYPDIRLRCYQSNHPEETPGTPFTRLVIEGKISGQTYYWPININRKSDGDAGVWRNHRYTYDIKITGKGSSYPDFPIETKDIIINQEVAVWKEMEEYGVSY